MATILPTERLAGGAAPPAPPGWPPPWQSPAPDELAVGRVSWPPTADQLDYVQKAITVFLLALALPAIVTALIRRPESALAGLARRHVA